MSLYLNGHITKFIFKKKQNSPQDYSHYFKVSTVSKTNDFTRKKNRKDFNLSLLVVDKQLEARAIILPYITAHFQNQLHTDAASLVYLIKAHSH